VPAAPVWVGCPALGASAGRTGLGVGVTADGFVNSHGAFSRSGSWSRSVPPGRLRVAGPAGGPQRSGDRGDSVGQLRAEGVGDGDVALVLELALDILRDRDVEERTHGRSGVLVTIRRAHDLVGRHEDRVGARVL